MKFKTIVINNNNNNNKFPFLNGFQYFIALFIMILFIIGLWQPYFYKNIFLISGLLFLQIILSIIRSRLLNIILEIFLLILILPSSIPYLGVFTIFLQLVISMIDMATFKGVNIYKSVKTKNVNNYLKKKKIKKEQKGKIYEAEFKEK